MKPFVAFRYPNQKAFYLEHNSKGHQQFIIHSHKGLSAIISGSKVGYSGQLINTKTPVSKKQIYISSQEVFLNQSDRLHQLIQNSKLKKAILSRITDTEIGSLDLDNLFNLLCSNYKDAFVYLLYHPSIGMWSGASPEILAKWIDGALQTEALAGTKLNREDRNWTEKEIKEQQYVEKQIESIIEQNGLSITNKKGPFDKVAGKITHICTEFTIQSTNEEAKEFVKQLHPTSAVAGLPRQNSLDAIQSIEKHQRELYTGFLGMDEENQFTYYVNLRCMQLIENKAYIYVGGGHTIESDPQKEWEETSNKAKTMQDVLQQL